MQEKRTAHYRILSDSGGRRYKFFCDLSGALLCTTKIYNTVTPESEPELAWENEGKRHFQLCHKCGRWVMDALYNADALECVACAVWENTPEYCKHCGTKVVLSDSICPKCGERLLYGGSFNEQFT